MKELTPNNPFYLTKWRTLEIKNFALQYPEWKKQLTELPLMHGIPSERVDCSRTDIYEKRIELLSKIEMVERACKMGGEDMWTYILKGMTEGLTYENLTLVHGMPCCRNHYYRYLRASLYFLSEIRK